MDLLKNYYHYFVQPEPEKSIMLVYNYIYIQKTELSKQNKNILLLHTRENYAYNDHDLVTRPLPMNFECRNNSNLEFSNIEMFINRNPFLSWHVYSSIDHYIKLHHYHIKKLNTNYLVYKTQSDFSLPPIMSWIKTCHTIPQFAGLNFVTVFLFICTIISWTRVRIRYDFL